MKPVILGLLMSGLISSIALAQAGVVSPARSPIAQLTPVAAKCDISACQTQCYVERSHCKTRDNSACGTEAQMCVQACNAQCK